MQRFPRANRLIAVSAGTLNSCIELSLLEIPLPTFSFVQLITCCVCFLFLSENNVQEELFDQILRGKLEFPSPDWDTISLPAKVQYHTHS